MPFFKAQPLADGPPIFAFDEARPYATLTNPPTGRGFLLNSPYFLQRYNPRLTANPPTMACWPGGGATRAYTDRVTQGELEERGIRGGWAVRLVLGNAGLLGVVELGTSGVFVRGGNTDPVMVGIRGVSWWIATDKAMRGDCVVHPTIEGKWLVAHGDDTLRGLTFANLSAFTAHTKRVAAIYPTLRPQLASWTEAWGKATVLFDTTRFDHTRLDADVRKNVVIGPRKSWARRAVESIPSHDLYKAATRVADACTYDTSVFPFLAQAFTTTLPLCRTENHKAPGQDRVTEDAYTFECIAEALGDTIHPARIPC
jgi:hypothetical protein